MLCDTLYNPQRHVKKPSPAAENSSCPHSPVLSMLWMVSTTRVRFMPPSCPPYTSQKSMAAAQACHSCTCSTCGAWPEAAKY